MPKYETTEQYLLEKIASLEEENKNLKDEIDEDEELIGKAYHILVALDKANKAMMKKCDALKRVLKVERKGDKEQSFIAVSSDFISSYSDKEKYEIAELAFDGMYESDSFEKKDESNDEQPKQPEQKTEKKSNEIPRFPNEYDENESKPVSGAQDGEG